MSFNNIAVGTDQLPLAPFNLSHQCVTTADFGELQPISCYLAHTRGKHKIKTETAVRLSELQRPVFGDMYLKTYHQFVPIESVFKKFPQFLSRIRALQNTSDYPTGTLSQFDLLPSITAHTLTNFLIRKPNGYATIYKRGQESVNDDWVLQSFAVTDQGLNSSLPHRTEYQTGGVGDWVAAIAHRSHAHYFEPETADFTCIRRYTREAVDGGCFKWCIKLNKRGLRLYKILTGLGYKPMFGVDNVNYSLLPLMCFYKAYWDIFHIDQYDNFESTALAKLIRFYDQRGVKILDMSLYTDTANDDYDFTHYQLVKQFFIELEDCFYSANKDFVSAHENHLVPSWSSNNTNVGIYDDLSIDYAPRNTSTSNYANLSTNQNYATLGLLSQTLYQLDIELLKKFYYWSRRRQIIGNDIKAVLQAKGLGMYCEQVDAQSGYIGCTTTRISVSQLLSTADTRSSDGTTGEPIGAYAGQASAYNKDDGFSFTNNCPGYFLSMSCIVPESRLANGVPTSLLGICSGGEHRKEFYLPMFDGFGTESTPNCCIGHDKINFSGITSSDTCLSQNIFGDIPRYTGLKIGNDIRNGMFNLWSCVNSMSPWHLQKMLVLGVTNRNSVKDTSTESSTQHRDNFLPNMTSWDIVPPASRSWRFPTRTRGVGNYNRIFYEGSIPDHSEIIGEDYEWPSDNFMIFIDIRHTAQMHMLPIARSFDTLDEEEEKTGDGAMYVRD